MTNEMLLQKRGRPLLGLLTLGLLFLLGAALSYFNAHPSLVVHTSFQQASGSEPGTSPGEGMAMSGDSMQQGVMNLMKKLQENPSDHEALLGLAEHFTHLQEWSKAETFALRALVAVPADVQTLYLLGIIQHNQKRHAEAAATLEKVVVAKDDPSVRYSLGMLYAYYLNQPDKGLIQLRQALDMPNITPELKSALNEEIEKIEGHKKHTLQSGTSIQ